jgi:sugar phosphate permease
MTQEVRENNDSLSSIKWAQLIILCFGGGIVYLLPYLRLVFYQPLQVALHINNTQLGLIGSVYGILTIVCYFPGGWLADRVSPRKMLTFSFLATGLGGLYYAQFTSFHAALLLNIYFGITTTLTFWAAFIKATRICASSSMQGKVFGFQEGGRRIVSTLIAFVGVGVFAAFGSGIAGLSMVVYTYSAFYILLAVVAWFVFSDEIEEEGESKTSIVTWESLKQTLQIPAIWQISLIIFCAYASYRYSDFLTPYMTQIMGVSATIGALLGTVKSYALGPFGAIGAGIVADRITASKAVIGGFIIVAVTNVLYAVFPGTPALLYIVVVNLVIMMTAHFAVRGIYYSLLEEGHISIAVTGIATGIIATIGYLPDVWAPVAGGYVLDTFPGILGFKYNFLISAFIAVLGIVLTVIYRKGLERQAGVKIVEVQA